MLLASQFDLLIDPVLDLFETYQETVVLNIARRLASLDFASPTAAWQVQRLSESGLLYERILEELAKLTGRSEIELARMFERAGVKALAFDDAIYRAAGLKPLPLNLSPAMLDVLQVGLQRTAGTLRNLTSTTAIAGQQAFERAADLAYMQITSGAFDYQSALKQAVKTMAGDGLEVIQFARRNDKIDVAVRRAVLTGVNQTAAELTLARADEMGTDLVQTSAHVGARPSHQEWQGKIFSRSGVHPKYPPFVESTGYGTVTGLSGINCRHSFFPWFENISENAYTQEMLKEMNSKTVEYNGQTLDFYSATQQQRYLERHIRKAKREASALEAAGLDNDRELAKVKFLQAAMRSFVKQTGLQRQYFREQK